jgi:hypothetical protein
MVAVIDLRSLQEHEIGAGALATNQPSTELLSREKMPNIFEYSMLAGSSTSREVLTDRAPALLSERCLASQTTSLHRPVPLQMQSFNPDTMQCLRIIT